MKNDSFKIEDILGIKIKIPPSVFPGSFAKATGPKRGRCPSSQYNSFTMDVLQKLKKSKEQPLVPEYALTKNASATKQWDLDKRNGVKQQQQQQ
jgi:hypothetical protein